jgi:hypothetical protein
MEKQFSLKDKPSGRGYIRHYSEERIRGLFISDKTPEGKSVADLIAALEVGAKFDCDKISMPNSFIGMEVLRVK